MTEKEKIAVKVLEYWRTIEFLGQDSYETCTDSKKLKSNLFEFKNSSPKDKKAKKQIMICKPLNQVKDIYQLILNEAQECDMKTWGNLTFYVGKVKRQACIRQLANELHIKNFEQAEKNTDDIAVLSFQCDQNGVYIQGSLSLSPIIWVLLKINSNPDKPLFELISIDAYRSTVDRLEKELFEEKNFLDEVSDTVSTAKSQTQSYPAFSAESVTLEEIIKIQNKVTELCNRAFIVSDIQDAINPLTLMKFQLFKNQESKDKCDEDNYTGLSYNFFSLDLDMVKENIINDVSNSSKKVPEALLDYICAPYYEYDKQWRRYDLVKPNNKDEFTSQLLDILNIRHAPLGKWPSRYMPSLMQQVAINFAISDKDIRYNGSFDEIGDIFSVNGPPGTGKTTLLKEVIADHIVKKAQLLSQYDTPDKAFKKNAFKYGDKNGAYSQFFKNWYSFTDDHIGEHSILVVSCNNAAVENITKELPQSGGINDQLKISTDPKHPDSEEMKRQLTEVSKLFLANNSTNEIHNSENIYENQNNYNEIYFTQYANKLFESKTSSCDAWGLIAAPLGKKSNINDFYYRVLNPILYDLLRSNDMIDNRIQDYRNARDRFLKQLSLVKNIQNQLSIYADNAQSTHEKVQKYKKIKEQNEKICTETREKLSQLSNELLNAEAKVNFAKAEYDKAYDDFNTCSEFFENCKKKFENLKNLELEYRQKAYDAEKSVSFITKIFRKKKYQAAIDLASAYTEKADEYSASVSKCESELKPAESDYKRAEEIKNAAQEKLEAEKDQLMQMRDQKARFEENLIRLKTEIKEAKEDAEFSEKQCKMLMDEFRNASETETGSPIDDKLIADILSEDQEPSTKAQLVNPWTTQRYNREREKLLYYALQMTKEFLLSSKCCRANLNILGQYWGLKLEKDGSRIIFHEADRKAMASSLYQTLFLLVPVISSTFASVGRLLKDMDKPGSIGTLIIDEAGQAQPQMAVGSIYRAKRVLVVGDPKQVEPVVTDDLKLLKEAFSERLYSNYKNKSLSVQKCADIINPFGTSFNADTDDFEWLGCPLLVHRRCISPMYNISNRISYEGIMKQKTEPPKEDKKSLFLLKSSQWINIAGDEKGRNNHYVQKQGLKVCEFVEKAFKKSDFPNLYIISPFSTVVDGIRKELSNFANINTESVLAQKDENLKKWIKSNIGTVHKFQGKEANEVIFLLGCDLSQKGKYAVRSFVNSNIVNVAVTRAKYRLYIIGDARVWKNNDYVFEAKSIMDTLPIENMVEIDQSHLSPEDRKKKMLEQAEQFPGALSFAIETGVDELGNPELQLDTDGFVKKLNSSVFLNQKLSDEQIQKFGFSSIEEFNSLPENIKKTLCMAIKLYFLLAPIYQNSSDLDASCCGVLFCKATELKLKDNFVDNLKKCFPDLEIKKGLPLRKARDKDFMIGKIVHILLKTSKEIAKCLKKNGDDFHTETWWDEFINKLDSFRDKRNQCCHSQLFPWSSIEELLTYGFEKSKMHTNPATEIGGVFFESSVGEKLRNINE